ncbi:MAG: ABC transporter permease subunit, partial [Chloroflexi bacterium]|nr:ABC transporter permease subunit [Chloroflexota bacterium]
MPVLRRTLGTLRWQIVGYGLGLFAWAAVVVLLYPTIRDMYAGIELPEAYRTFFGESAMNLGDFRNFASVELYQWIPLVMTIYVIVSATGTLAGDEGHGVLEILLTQPLSRRRVFLEKAGALAIGAVAIAAISALGIAATLPFVDTPGGVSVGAMVAYVFATLPFVLLVGSLALLLAAVAPTRVTAAAIAAAVVVGAWLAASLADLSSQTQWLKYLSGYYYADVQQIPIAPPQIGHLAIVLAAT